MSRKIYSYCKNPETTASRENISIREIGLTVRCCHCVLTLEAASGRPLLKQNLHHHHHLSTYSAHSNNNNHNLICTDFQNQKPLITSTSSIKYKSTKILITPTKIPTQIPVSRPSHWFYLSPSMAT